MKKSAIMDKVKDFSQTQNIIYFVYFVIFCVLFTAIISCKYIFLQSFTGKDNISKSTIVAPKEIKVTDVLRTEKRKQEVSQNVSPIYTPVDDQYIQNNLLDILSYITNIRESNQTYSEKQKALDLIFDISDQKTKGFVINFFINADNLTFETVSQKAQNTLAGVLDEGVTEKDFKENTIINIINRNIDVSTTRNQIRVIVALIEQVIVPNLVVDENATAIAKKNAMDLISPIKVVFKKGEPIVNEGEIITQVKKDALSKAGYNILDLDYGDIISMFCLTLISVFGILCYLNFYEKQFFDKSHILIIATSTICVTTLAVFIPYNWSVYILPFPLFATILAIFLDSKSSFVITVTLLALITLLLQFSALAMAVFILATLMIVVGLTRIRFSRRFDLIKIGFFLSIAMLVLIFAVHHDAGRENLIKDLISGVFNGAATGLIVLGLIPLFENIFGVITNYGLSELGDHNQPLLKRLQFDAPGTFSHSLMVSNLAEAAAEAIGANPVLARVGSLYHDVGKIIRPLFFIENQTYNDIQNPHEKLNPRLSKMVITAHTKDGLNLAKEYHLPKVIQDFIVQHHGDSLASYFYNQAVQQEGRENVPEEQFRYTGPRPDSKETAILMLADAVESASRTLKDHSQEEIDSMIHKIFSDRLADNQLSDSPLTLKDLDTIASTFSRVLRSIHHKRIKYQENIIEELEKKVQKPNKNNEQNN